MCQHLDLVYQNTRQKRNKIGLSKTKVKSTSLRSLTPCTVFTPVVILL